MLGTMQDPRRTGPQPWWYPDNFNVYEDGEIGGDGGRSVRFRYRPVEFHMSAWAWTCGNRQPGMIAEVSLRLLYLIFSRLLSWLTLLGRASASKDVETHRRGRLPRASPNSTTAPSPDLWRRGGHCSATRQTDRANPLRGRSWLRMTTPSGPTVMV